MNTESYYYNCSPEYIESIDPDLSEQILSIIKNLPKRQTQSEINADLFWSLTKYGWSYDTVPTGARHTKPDINVESIKVLKKRNDHKLCLTSSTLKTKWHADFARSYGSKLVQVEAQFGKVEAMFKDFCGFRIAYAERRLALGIMIVLCDPNSYFAHRRNAIGGMANFNIYVNNNRTGLSDMVDRYSNIGGFKDEIGLRSCFTVNSNHVYTIN